MKLLESRSAFLTNYEVARHLDSLTAMQDSMLKQGSYSSALESENLRTIQFELKAYLDEQPCQTLTPEKLSTLLLELKKGGFGLTKVEKLMILNQVPGNEAEISVLLEEYSERFTEEERASLLLTIENCLGKRSSTSEDVEAEADDDVQDQDDEEMQES